MLLRVCPSCAERKAGPCMLPTVVAYAVDIKERAGKEVRPTGSGWFPAAYLQGPECCTSPGGPGSWGIRNHHRWVLYTVQMGGGDTIRTLDSRWSMNWLGSPTWSTTSTPRAQFPHEFNSGIILPRQSRRQRVATRMRWESVAIAQLGTNDLGNSKWHGSTPKPN